MLMKLRNASGLLLAQYRLSSIPNGLQLVTDFPDVWVVEFEDDKGLIARFRKEVSFGNL